MDGWEKTKKKKTQTFEYLDFTALFFVRVCVVVRRLASQTCRALIPFFSFRTCKLLCKRHVEPPL